MYWCYKTVLSAEHHAAHFSNAATPPNFGQLLNFKSIRQQKDDFILLPEVRCIETLTYYTYQILSLQFYELLKTTLRIS